MGNPSLSPQVLFPWGHMFKIFYSLLPFYFFSFLFLNFTILYWFCQISKWICHRYTCVPHPEPSSLLPPHTIPLGHILAGYRSLCSFFLLSLERHYCSIFFFTVPDGKYAVIFIFVTLHITFLYFLYALSSVHVISVMLCHYEKILSKSLWYS